MTPATAGSIVLGILCVAALTLILIGAVRLMRASRELKTKLSRVQEAQTRLFNAQRFSAAMTRIARDADSANELLERARRAVSTIGAGLHYCALAVRIVKRLT